MQPASHDYHTVESGSAHQENQPQYEVPVPQKHNVYESNEVGKRETVRIVKLCIMNGCTFLHVGICNTLQLGALCSNRGM